ncbi:MAG: hypothetical protein QOH00_3223, partial [Gaiellales bacterium]|nr:hypothetical protein [Gaiellales bacterium]
MSGADERRSRRFELRRRQIRRRRISGAALIVAVGGIGIWAAATLASGGGHLGARTAVGVGLARAGGPAPGSCRAARRSRGGRARRHDRGSRRLVA